MTRLGLYKVHLPPLPALPGAACVGHDPTLWDDRLPGETSGQALSRQATARAICADCPVRSGCADARDRHDSGIWGGVLWLRYGGRVHRARPHRPMVYTPLSELADRDAAVVVMTREGRSVREIAQTLGLARSTIAHARTRLRRAGVALTDESADDTSAHHREAG